MRLIARAAFFGSMAWGLAIVLAIAPPAAAQAGATFTVTSTDDPAIVGPIDGVCLDGGGVCTLREAIMEANNLPGLDTIRFAIAGTGPHSIMVGGPESGLPEITDPVLIDGTTQDGYAPGAPAVVLDGSALFQAEAGLTVTLTNNVTIRGLHVRDFPGAGISVGGSLGQFTDVTILGNTIDSNAGHGVEVFFEEFARIGSSTLGEANTIIRNGGHGVYVEATSDSIIEGNFIGTDGGGSPGLGNAGAGAAVDGLSFNIAILENAITDNGVLGIDVGDDRLASVENAPVLAGVSHPTAGTARATGGLDVGFGTYLVEFFRNDACDASGHGEGAVLVGSGEVEAFGEGAVFFDIPLGEDVGSGFLTATATRQDPESLALVETGEFSACLRLDPTASFMVDANTPDGTLGAVATRVDFTDLSVDPDGTIVAWSWDFGDGATGTAQNPSHTYATAATYAVVLTVTDDRGGTNATEASITVEEAIEVLVETTCAERDGSFAMAATSAVVPEGRFEWDFGDGLGATGSFVEHTWTALGVYTVTVQVFEDNSEWEGDPLIGSTSFTLIVYVFASTGEGLFVPADSTVSLNASQAFDLLLTGGAEGAFVSGSVVVSPRVDCLFEGVAAIVPTDPSTPRVRALGYLEADHFGPGDGLSMIEVRLYYDPQDASALRIPETALSLWYWNGTAWVDTRSVANGGTIAGATPAEDLVVFARGVNTAQNYVWARVDHTSTFAVGGAPRTGGGGPPLPTEDPSTEEPPAEDPPEETPPEDDGNGDDGTVADPSTDSTPPREVRLTIYVNDQPITQPLNGVHGRIRIALQGDDGEGNRLRIYIVDQAGFEYYLGFADEVDELDTAEFPNGVYTLEIRDYGDPRPGVFTTAQAYTVVRAENILIQNALATPTEAVAAVAVTAGLIGLGALLTQTFWTRFAQTLAEAGKESAISVGEDRLRKHGRGRRALGRRADGAASLYTRRIGPWIAFMVAVALLGFFFTFEGVEGAYAAGFFADFGPVFLVIGSAAFVFFLGQFSLEMLANRLSGAVSRFRFLWPGAIALAVSAVAFRTPFGYPGYVYEEETEETRHVVRMKGIRALGVFGVMLALLIPFILVGYQWRWDFAQAGILVGLVALGTSTLPFAPLPGADVWRWRKTLSIPVIAGAFVLFFGFQLALWPVDLFLLLGAIGLPSYVLVIAWLHIRGRDPVPAWYGRFAGRYEAFERWIEGQTPAGWKRFRAWRARAASRVSKMLLWPVRSVAASTARAVHRRRARRAVPHEA